MGSGFFGLATLNREQLYLEEIDFLIEHRSMDYWSIFYMPVRIRKWFVNKTIERLQRRHQEAESSSSQSKPQNSQDAAKKLDILKQYSENLKNR